jgi:hypothetical protein
LSSPGGTDSKEYKRKKAPAKIKMIRAAMNIYEIAGLFLFP